MVHFKLFGSIYRQEKLIREVWGGSLFCFLRSGLPLGIRESVSSFPNAQSFLSSFSSKSSHLFHSPFSGPQLAAGILHFLGLLTSLQSTMFCGWRCSSCSAWFCVSACHCYPNSYLHLVKSPAISWWVIKEQRLECGGWAHKKFWGASGVLSPGSTLSRKHLSNE